MEHYGGQYGGGLEWSRNAQPRKLSSRGLITPPAVTDAYSFQAIIPGGVT